MSVWTIPGHATRARTATARRWATNCCLFREHRLQEPAEFPESAAWPGDAYTINEVAVPTGDGRSWQQALVEALQTGPCHFAAEAAWQARLQELGSRRSGTCARHRRGVAGPGDRPGVFAGSGDPQRRCEQFNLLAHAACWVHAERPLVRLIPYNEAHRAVIAGVRQHSGNCTRPCKPSGETGPCPEAGSGSAVRHFCEQRPSIRASTTCEGDASAQGRPVAGVGVPGGAAAQQRDGIDHSGLRAKAEDQRQHPQRVGPALPDTFVSL